jgi:hypothetical protein
MARKIPKRASAPRPKTPPADGLSANGLRLWAPWRYKYISSAAKQDSCIFCFGDIAKAERKRRLILHFEEHAVVMLNRYPYNNGHLMVAPRRHVARRNCSRARSAVSSASWSPIAARSCATRSIHPASTSARISAAARARESPTTCIGTSCRDGMAIPTSCRCWRRRGCCRSIWNRASKHWRRFSKTSIARTRRSSTGDVTIDAYRVGSSAMPRAQSLAHSPTSNVASFSRWRRAR